MRWKCSTKRKRIGRLLGMVETFDPKSIEDEGLRQIVIGLMNLVESLQAKLAQKDEETQQLRDEINRLKGEQGKPKIAANKPSPDLSQREATSRVQTSRKEQQTSSDSDRSGQGALGGPRAAASRCSLQRIRGHGGAGSLDS